MALLQRLSFFLLQIFIERNAISDQIVKSEIEDDFYQLAGESFAFDN